jgi:hypothetical protein
MKKFILLGLSVSVISIAFAGQHKHASRTPSSSQCQDLSKITDAAVKAANSIKANRPAQSIGQDPVFVRTTSTGKDQWQVQIGVEEQCDTMFLVNVKAGTCDVEGTPFELDNTRDCG